MTESKQQKADCPYCRTKDVAFTIRCYCESQDLGHRLTLAQHLTDTFAVCGRCSRAVVMTFIGDRHGTNDIRIAPSPPEPPEHLPDNVMSDFRQGINNVSEHFDAAAAMFRATLETALKEKLCKDDNDRTTLSRLIEEGKEKQILTADLAEWAKHIKLGGNYAMHRAPLSKEEAQEFHDFTDLVLRYLYTLPGMLKEAQNRQKTQGSTEPSKQSKQWPDIKPLRGLPG